jgi:hypothetical protein
LLPLRRDERLAQVRVGVPSFLLLLYFVAYHHFNKVVFAHLYNITILIRSFSTCYLDPIDADILVPSPSMGEGQREGDVYCSPSPCILPTFASLSIIASRGKDTNKNTYYLFFIFNYFDYFEKSMLTDL